MKAIDTMTPAELGESGQKEALPILMRYMQQGSANDRRLAASAVGKLVEKYPEEAAAVIPALLTLAQDKYPQVRLYALKTLMLLVADLSATHAMLFEAIAGEDENPFNRKLAERILSHLETSPNSKGTAHASARPVDPPTVIEQQAEDETSHNAETLRIGVGHLFTTGPRPFRDQVLHLAGTCYSTEHGPFTRAWMLNPERPITKRIYERSRVSSSMVQVKPTWEEIESSEITPFFADLDILFVFNLDNQLEWFKRVVLKGAKHAPLCVDLYTLAQFFLPERTLYDPEELLEHYIPHWNQPGHRDAPDKSGPRLRYVLRCAEALLQDVLGSVFLKFGAEVEKHLIYALLQRAMEGAKPPADFEALYRVAKQAHEMRWSDDLFATPFETPSPYPLQMLKTKTLDEAFESLLPNHESEKKSADEAEGDKERVSPSEGLRRLLHAPSSPERPKPVKREHVDEAFSKLAEDVAVIKGRSAQRDYAHFLANAFSRGGVYAIEAGTGTGKTLGYLVPACEYVRQNPSHKVVVVTATKNLQDQVAANELPRLIAGKTLYQNLQGAVLKGKANYLCISALVDLFRDIYIQGGEVQSRLAWLYLALRVIRCGGELEGIPWSLKERFPVLRDLCDEVNAQVACLPDLCRLKQSCVYPRQLSKAYSADIVVTNQHKLATLPDPIRERASVCVVDEADQFPENFRASLTEEIDSTRIRWRFLNRTIGTRKRRGFSQILEEHLRNDHQYASDEAAHRAIEKSLDSLRTIQAECHAIDVLLRAIGDIPQVRYEGEYRWIKLRPFDAGERLQKSLRQLAQHGDRIAQCWENILKSGRYQLLETATPDSGKKQFLRSEKARVGRYRELTLDLKRVAQHIAADFPSTDYVHTYSRQRRGWALAKIPFNIEEAVKALLKTFPAVAFTSATLFVDDRLNLFAEELCLKQPFDESRRIPSPFPYEKNVYGSVTTFIRPYRWDAPVSAKKQWQGEVATTIAALSVATYGRTLVLFTNTAEMKSLFREIQPILERHDVEPIMQNGSSLAEISAFRASEHSVLFGVDRFWTGVDFPGPTLSQVIVVRLPNPNLSHPLIEHRRDLQGEAFWESYYHPVTKLTLKQGFGRLIRSEKDRGIFVVLDQRLVEDARMQGLQSELPIRLHTCRVFNGESRGGDLRDLVSQGLKVLGLHTEFEERGINLYNL